MDFNLEEEFKKNPELKQEDIDHVKDWVAKQPHLPAVTDREVVLFLHSCRYKLEATKNTIESFFTIRTSAPEIFSNRDPKSTEICEALETMAMFKLPEKSVDGYDVFFSKFRRLEPELYVMADVIKAYHMHADVCQKDCGTTPGILYIVDVQGFSLGHVMRINMSAMKTHIYYLQEALPSRLMGIHLLNCVPFIDMVMNMLKPFMKSELLNMFHYHQANSDKIYEYVPKSILPKDYGGEGPSVQEQAAETMKLLQENHQWFVEEAQRRVDETKRQGKPKTARNELDMIGSFKKISFD